LSLPEVGTTHFEEHSELTDSDWLTQNLIGQYWKGEELEVDSGQYRTCHLNTDWFVFLG